MTKFMKMGQDAPKQGKKTVFNRMAELDGEIIQGLCKPCEWGNVMFLYRDAGYGDVFLAWNEGSEHNRIIYFGEKGDEFDEL